MKALLTVMCMFFLFFAAAQNKDSVTCLPTAQLRQAIKINEKFKLLSQIDSANISYINTQSLTILNRNTTIFKMSQTIDQQNQVVASQKIIIDGSDTKSTIEQGVITDLQKSLNKQTTKTWLVGAGGTILSTILLVLLIKK